MRLEVSPDQPQVVSQPQHHVLCVNDGHGVFEINYVGDGRLHHQVLELAILLIDLAALVELESQLQSVVFQEELG